ncbi:MAG: hypothetical protein HRT35_23120 [Algicola sp.]|nr:hypothetical protein [Algicola sp.]
MGLLFDLVVDGNQFTDLAKSHDVIGHELTHGVTRR